jgi:hypothetical protein
VCTCLQAVQQRLTHVSTHLSVRCLCDCFPWLHLAAKSVVVPGAKARLLEAQQQPAILLDNSELQLYSSMAYVAVLVITRATGSHQAQLPQGEQITTALWSVHSGWL